MDNQNNYTADDEDICVTLEMEDGSKVECDILTIFDVDDQDYIVLLPLDENNEENEEGTVYIYRYFEDEDGNPSMENILDDEEYETVAEKFEELLEEAEYEEI